MAIENDLQLIIDADAALFEYMRRQVITGIWPRGSRRLDVQLTYTAAIEVLNGVVNKIDGRNVEGIGWATEGAILKGVNRILAKKTHEFPGDELVKYRVGIEQVRSLLSVGLQENSIKREVHEYIMRPDTVTFYRLTPEYFLNELAEMRKPQWEPSP